MPNPDHPQAPGHPLPLFTAAPPPPGGILSRTLLQTPSTRQVVLALASGEELSDHSSTRLATILILQGRCTFTLEGRAMELSPGDWLEMPPGAVHSVTARENLTMVLTLVQPPSRG